MYLRSIVSLCKEHWDKSSFVCDYKNLSFPSFSITENQYKKMVVENLTDMVRTIVLEDDFKIKENFGIDNFSFNMIEKSQEAKYKGNETREQRQVNLIFDQLFITKINNIKKILLLGLCFGLGIETIQYLETFLTKGFSYRIIDINDVIFNFTGTVIGFFVLYVFSRLFIKMKEENLNAFWKHVYKTCDSVSIK